MSGQTTYSKTPGPTQQRPYSGGSDTYRHADHEGEERGWASNAVHSAGATVAGVVQRYPASATLLAAGLGFATGVCLGMLFSQPAKQKGAMARFGQSVWDAMAKAVPDSLKR